MVRAGLQDRVRWGKCGVVSGIVVRKSSWWIANNIIRFHRRNIEVTSNLDNVPSFSFEVAWVSLGS